MKKCPRCGASYPDEFQFCENDGADLPRGAGEQELSAKMVVLGVSLLVVVAAAAWALFARRGDTTRYDRVPVSPSIEAGEVIEPPPTDHEAVSPHARVGRLTPHSIWASSYFHDRDTSFSPSLAFDGDPTTAWNDGVEGSPVGQWIEARFDRPQRFRRVVFTPGWTTVSRHGRDLFLGNARIRVATVLVDGVQAGAVTTTFDQRSSVVELDVTGTSLRLVATDVHPGSRWQDVCISEIQIEGDL